MKRAANLIEESCAGLMHFLQELHQVPGSETFASRLDGRVKQMDTIKWLVPPMLQGKRSPLKASV